MITTKPEGPAAMKEFEVKKVENTTRPQQENVPRTERGKNTEHVRERRKNQPNFPIIKSKNQEIPPKVPSSKSRK